jgi:hypothetical protein
LYWLFSIIFGQRAWTIAHGFDRFSVIFAGLKKCMAEERLVVIIDFTPPQKLGFSTFDMV